MRRLHLDQELLPLWVPCSGTTRVLIRREQEYFMEAPRRHVFRFAVPHHPIHRQEDGDVGGKRYLLFGVRTAGSSSTLQGLLLPSLYSGLRRVQWIQDLHVVRADVDMSGGHVIDKVLLDGRWCWDHVAIHNYGLRVGVIEGCQCRPDALHG